MVRYLAISFLAAVLLGSCSLKTTEGLRQVHFNKTDVKNPYFSNPEMDYVYKAKIQLYKKNFGGILIVKKMGPESHRVVFTTEFGSKLFDFAFEGDTFTNHFVVKDLDRKFIIDILKNDFKLLVNETAKVLAVYESPNERIYKTQSGDRFNFYFLDDRTERLQKIVNTTKTKEIVAVVFTPASADVAAVIAIRHENIKLTIDLNKFKNEKYVD